MIGYQEMGGFCSYTCPAYLLKYHQSLEGNYTRTLVIGMLEGSNIIYNGRKKCKEMHLQFTSMQCTQWKLSSVISVQHCECIATFGRTKKRSVEGQGHNRDLVLYCLEFKFRNNYTFTKVQRSLISLQLRYVG